MTPSVEEVIRSATEPRALDAPCAYLNTAINLLEFMIETCTGTNSAALMDRAALASLGMEGASFDWTGAKIPVCHDLRGRPVAPCIYPCRASGRLQATAIDIAHFAAAGLAGAKQCLLPGEAVAEMHRRVGGVSGGFPFATDGCGMGHFTETLSDGRQAVWHDGQEYGWMSHKGHFPLHPNVRSCKDCR